MIAAKRLKHEQPSFAMNRQLGETIKREMESRLEEYRALRGNGIVHFMWDEEIVLTLTYDTGTITVYDRSPEKEKLLQVAKDALNKSGLKYEEKRRDLGDPRINRTVLKVV
jgi:hypothetical protein